MHIIAVVNAAILLIITGAAPSWTQASASISGTTEQMQVVRTIVTEFGKRLRMVAVLAPKDMVTQAMNQEYATFVAADLLTTWKNNPENAPGKRTSSPSPERIDITSIEAKGRDAYMVTGKVILLTAQERREGGIFQANPVSITVAQQHGKWVITAYGGHGPLAPGVEAVAGPTALQVADLGTSSRCCRDAPDVDG
jgi:hypothetical protein